MASTIDRTQPPSGAPLVSADIRNGVTNAAADDIDALQANKAPISHVGAGGVAQHPVSTTGAAGFAPALSGSASDYLDGSGSFSVPPGGSQGNLTGDVSSVGLVTTINPNVIETAMIQNAAVANAKLDTMPAWTLKAQLDPGGGTPSDLGLTSVSLDAGESGDVLLGWNSGGGGPGELKKFDLDTVGNFHNHTGDVTSADLVTTISNSAVTEAKIDDAAVTYAKMQNFSPYSFIGRSTAGAGVGGAILEATLTEEPSPESGDMLVGWEAGGAGGGAMRKFDAAAFLGGAASPLTTKGDLYGFGTADDRLPVGNPGQIITANPAAPLGIEYVDPPSGTGDVSSAANTVDGEIQLGAATAKGIKGLVRAAIGLPLLSGGTGLGAGPTWGTMTGAFLQDGTVQNGALADMPGDTIKMNPAVGSGAPTDTKISNLQNQLTPIDTDYLMVETAAGLLRHITIDQLPGGGGGGDLSAGTPFTVGELMLAENATTAQTAVAADFTTITPVDPGDFVIGYLSTGELSKYAVGDLAPAGTVISNTDTSADEIQVGAIGANRTITGGGFAAVTVLRDDTTSTIAEVGYPATATVLATGTPALEIAANQFFYLTGATTIALPTTGEGTIVAVLAASVGSVTFSIAPDATFGSDTASTLRKLICERVQGQNLVTWVA